MPPGFRASGRMSASSFSASPTALFTCGMVFSNCEVSDTRLLRTASTLLVKASTPGSAASTVWAIWPSCLGGADSRR